MNQFCPKCGAKLLDPNSKFCSQCGANLTVKKEVNIDEMPEERIDLREGMTNRNKGMYRYTKWGKRKKKPVKTIDLALIEGMEDE